MRCIGLFGGTFDPVHNGHLRMALSLTQRLSFDQMYLLPCHQPPHRATPGCSSDERLQMVELAVQDCELLEVDGRELKRHSPSYTVETLAEIRREVGAEVSLCWCVGMDSLATLDTWYRWRELLDYAHLVVVGRPGWQVPSAGELGRWVSEHLASSDDLKGLSCGRVVIEEMSLLDISATEIRAEIGRGLSAQYLLPQVVWNYITKNKLYS